MGDSNARARVFDDPLGLRMPAPVASQSGFLQSGHSIQLSALDLDVDSFGFTGAASIGRQTPRLPDIAGHVNSPAGYLSQTPGAAFPNPRGQTSSTLAPIEANSISNPSPSAGMASYIQILTGASAQELYQVNPSFHQLYDDHTRLSMENNKLKDKVEFLTEELISKVKATAPTSQPTPSAPVTSFPGFPSYIPDGVDSDALRKKLDAAHRSDPTQPSLKQLFWFEAYFEKPKAAKEKKKGEAADPTLASKPSKRGAARMNAGENVNFGCLVHLDAQPIDGFELSDMGTFWERQAEWFVSSGIWPDTPEGFKAMPEVLLDFEMRARAHNIVFAYCSSGWKFFYFTQYKFDGFYKGNGEAPTKRRARVAQARGARLLSGEKAYYFKVEDVDEDRTKCAKRRRTDMDISEPQTSTVSSRHLSPSTGPRSASDPRGTSSSPASPSPSSSGIPLAPIESPAVPPTRSISPDATSNSIRSPYIDDIESMYADPPPPQESIVQPVAPTSTDMDIPMEGTTSESEGGNAQPSMSNASAARGGNTAQNSEQQPTSALSQDTVPPAPPTKEDGKAARREKAAARLQALKPDAPNHYTFPTPKTHGDVPGSTDTPQNATDTSTPAPPSAASSQPPDPVTSVNDAQRPLPSLPGAVQVHSVVQPHPARTDGIGRSRAFTDAVTAASALGGPLFKGPRDAQKAPSAGEAKKPKRRRRWTPGKGSDAIAACGRDWVTWPENRGQNRTQDEFYDFACTLLQAVVEQWRLNVVTQEDKDRVAAAQGHAVKAEGLATIGA